MVSDNHSAKKRVISNDPVGENDDNLSEFIKHLDSVDVKSPEAKQNETGMKDAQGKRIIFNEEDLGRKTFKGIEPPLKTFKGIEPRLRTLKGVEERTGTFKGVEVSSKPYKKI